MCFVFCLEHQANTSQRSDHIVNPDRYNLTPCPQGLESRYDVPKNGFLYQKASIEGTEMDEAPKATWGIERDTFTVIGKFSRLANKKG